MRNSYYEPIKVDTDNVLFWGCTHFDHDKEFLWGKRGFDSADEHNRYLIEKWNEKSASMGGGVTGILLGDTMFGYGGMKKFQSFLDRLDYHRLYLCAGNHPAGYKQSIRNLAFEENNWVTFMPNYFELRIKKQLVTCSHFPILSFRDMAKGAIHLYSHCHNNLKNSEIGRIYERDYKVLEVSVERSIEINNGEPFSFDEVMRYMRNQPSGSPDHH